MSRNSHSSQCLNVPRWFNSVAALVLVFILLTSISAFRTFWTPLPLYDSTSIVHFLSGNPDAFKTFQYLLEEHNEHRIVFTKALILIDFSWFRGTKLMPTALLLLLNASIALGLFCIFQKSMLSLRSRFLLAILLGILCFSLVQARNFDSVFQLQFFWVNLLALLSFASLSSWMHKRANSPAQSTASGFNASPFVLALGFSALAAFNMANGLFVCCLMALYLVLARQWRAAFITVVVSAGIWLLYFRGYTAPTGSGESAIEWTQVHMIAPFVTYFIGNIFNSGLPYAVDVIAFGCMGILLLAAFLLDLLKRGNAIKPYDRVALLLIAFVLASVGAASLQRLGRGDMELALVGRYSTLCVLFWAVLLAWWIQRTESLTKPIWRKIVLVVVSAIILGIAWRQALLFQQMRTEGVARQQANFALANDFTHPDVVRQALPAYETRTLAYLWENQLSVFRPATGTQVGEQLKFTLPLTDLPTLVPDHISLKAHAFDPRLMLDLQGQLPEGMDLPAARYVVIDDQGLCIGGAQISKSPIASRNTAAPSKTTTPHSLHWQAYITHKAGLSSPTWMLLKVRNGFVKPEAVARIRTGSDVRIPLRPVFDLGTFRDAVHSEVIETRRKWMQNGYFDALSPVHPTREIWGTWSPQLGDANTGSMVIHVARVHELHTHERVVLPVMVGPTPGACELKLRFSSPDHRNTLAFDLGEMIVDGWTYFDLTPYATASDLELEIHDRGNQWGQRVAFSMPVILQIDSNRR
ncbi:MAG: hypothetical protein ABQ298_13770 [Puniceicoccaceae bacterium]